MVVFLEGSSISTEELWSSVRVTIGFLVTFMTKGLLPQLLSCRATSFRKSLGGSELLKFKNDEATVFLGTFNAAEMFWCPSPDLCIDTILSRSSTDNSFNLVAWFLL